MCVSGTGEVGGLPLIGGLSAPLLHPSSSAQD